MSFSVDLPCLTLLLSLLTVCWLVWSLLVAHLFLVGSFICPVQYSAVDVVFALFLVDMGAWTLGWANAILFCFAEEPPCCFLLDVGPCAKAPKKCDIFKHTSQSVHSENPVLSFHCYYRVSVRFARIYRCVWACRSQCVRHCGGAPLFCGTALVYSASPSLSLALVAVNRFPSLPAPMPSRGKGQILFRCFPRDNR